MLTVQGLEAGYRGSRVLNGIDLEVAEGGIAALLGRNGMGKTTLMRALMGLVPVAAGRIVFQGRDIAGLRPYAISNLGIAYVPQGREIFADFTVEENLKLGLVGKPGGAGTDPASAYRHFPILAERRGQKAGTLSGGQQQQLAIARALVGRPRLLLLDEPSEGIQPSIVLQIAEILRRVAAEDGLTVLLVEQNVEIVLSLAADCAFIEKGRVVARHAAAELARDRDILHRYLAV
ncbi:MAG: ABC transporter ATP-binding protein [Rhodospirillales bacterium]|nr:ABC transporter ATP-binding protein [Rhodospirillales bacterium]MDH3791867.1 ABC transporter ATP-binding protein [Rhodospirillales bacterium]MDH3913706.1 ABC transporter ATP-binding protein [Rhodospirillales bacterium]MDH3966356.1 ABC transporter ATP-binding protein [Rhodospirillales bacterium]